MRHRFCAFVILAALCGCETAEDPSSAAEVGRTADGSHLVPTGQLIRPAGDTVEFAGRPVDLVISTDGRRLYSKDDRGLVVVDVESWKVVQEVSFGRAGTSMAGLALLPDSSRLYASTATDELAEAIVQADGTLVLARRITLPGPRAGEPSYPNGVAISKDGKVAYVCLSRNNTLAVVDLTAGRVAAEIPVGIAPFAVVISPDGQRAFVSNCGGRRPVSGDRTASSGGSQAVVEDWGGGGSGSVSTIDLAGGKAVGEIPTGLGPCGMAVSADGTRLYVANSNSDTVSVIDTLAGKVLGEIGVRPDASLPFGSMPSAVALSADGSSLYVANAGNNAVAVVSLAGASWRLAGFVPAGWYPCALVTQGWKVYVANTKGVGSRGGPAAGEKGRHVTRYRGTIGRFGAADPALLDFYTTRVREEGRVPQVLRSLERGDAGSAPVPVPARAGEPSLFEHVVYIIKENRTYDQVLGDIGKGNSDPSLCIYGREVTPNHHALAEQFVLLDNFYCNGVVSVDGHAWATEGNATPYLERSFGGVTRGYSFGDDALVYSSSKFIWDHVLARGLSFRNYGEFDNAGIEPRGGYAEVYRDWKEGTGRFSFPQNIGVENLRRYSSPDYPGWNMDIPDQVRADAFLRELPTFEKDNSFPNLVIVYLPNDHTSGTTPGQPTPRSYMADNDTALGRIVAGISRSKFWRKTCIFVMEDDPQDGFDHVDGHRSLCLVISPYTRRGAVVSDFYSQASVVHTIERILGATPANQVYAMAPVMTSCFTIIPDFTPYTSIPNRVPLAELNPPKTSLNAPEREWAELSESLALEKPDAIQEDLMNRILWHAARGTGAVYPRQFAGAHGKGLGALGLRLDERGVSDDDDD